MYQLNDEQRKLIESWGYIESATKPGLWQKTEKGKRTYLDFRGHPSTYAFKGPIGSPVDQKHLNLILAIKQGQSRLFNF